MRLIWTKSSLPLSVFIRAITGDPCSHFAFVFRSAAKGLMFEANLFGTHPKFYQNARARFDEVHVLDISLPIELEDAIWDIVVQKYDGKKYDYLGAMFLGWSKLKHRLFKTPLPVYNLWADENNFFCEEIASALAIIPGMPKVPTSGMETPEDLWNILKEWQYMPQGKETT